MTDTAKPNPTDLAAAMKAGLARQQARAKVVANPSQAAAPPSSAPTTASETGSALQLLYDLATGLERIARAEGAVPQPSGQAWGQLRKSLLGHLTAAGIDPNAAPIKPAILPGKQPVAQPQRMRMPTRAPIRAPYARPAARSPSGPPTRPVVKAK
jgi:hypothetical protein